MTLDDDLARYYDLDLADDPGDIDLYRALAARTGGPVLELGVGTGRIAVPLAESGLRVVGVDRDPAMLARAARRWAERGAARPAARKGHLDLVEGDLFDLRLEERFALAILGLNSLFLFGDPSRQAEAVAIMARHLAPGGLAAIDVFVPSVEDLAQYDGRLVLEWVRVDPERPATQVAKTGSAAYDPATRCLELTSMFDAWPAAGGPVERRMRCDVLHLTSAAEVAGFAARAGLAVEEIAGDHDMSPFGSGSGRAVVVAALV